MIFLGKKLGKDCYPYIVAEVSCSHEGNLDQAKSLIYAAKEAGADAVKIQTYFAEDMTINHRSYTGPQDNYEVINEFYVVDGPWKGKHLFDLYRKTQTPYEYIEPLCNYAKEINIPLFSSIFSLMGLALLEDLECPAYKIASFELTDTYLIRKVAKTGKPVILSTGMASYNEIEEAYKQLNPTNCIILHCVSSYPTKLEETNLHKIAFLKTNFDCPIGFSDHTEGHLASQLACGMGAAMIEKHIYLGGGGSEDATFSLTPQAFKFFVKACRRAAEASFHTHSIEEQYSRQFRRSLYVVKDVQKGENFTKDNIRSIRPSYGLSANLYVDVLTKRAAQDIKAGTALKQEMLE